jgi:hypothetical protein
MRDNDKEGSCMLLKTVMSLSMFSPDRYEFLENRSIIINIAIVIGPKLHKLTGIVDRRRWNSIDHWKRCRIWLGSHRFTALLTNDNVIRNDHTAVSWWLGSRLSQAFYSCRSAVDSDKVIDGTFFFLHLDSRYIFWSQRVLVLTR